jgi:acetyl-CoA carboxylase carboxyltransferase component
MAKKQDTITTTTGNTDHAALLAHLDEQLARIYQGGGAKLIEKHREKGKLPARERIALLLDDPTDYIEIGAFTADGMYAEEGGCPSAGVVVVMGKVSGRLCIIVANDATVKAGAWFPMTGKKNLRAQEIAIENRLPIIYLVDSAGVFLPMQAEIFPDKEHFGRIFRNNAVMSAMGIPQIAAIMGPCVAGGAYLPIMSDEALIVEGTGSLFLAGPYLVKAAIGEEVDIETLGGAAMHSEISGVTDYKMKNDLECLNKIRSLMSKLGPFPTAGFNRIDSQAPEYAPEKIFEILPATDRGKGYEMKELLKCLVDSGSLDEYKPDYGKTIVTAYARIDGWAVGIVANQRKVVKAKKPGNQQPEQQIGGVIYSDSADKAARFIMLCNQKRIPLVFLQDVTGFMVGSRSEQGGIIKDGAKMVNAMANSVVPKFTIIVGNSYGAGNYAMCGKAYDPRLIWAWPTAQIAVMSGASAAKTLLQIQTAALEKKGQKITPEAEAELLKEITDKYNSQLSPYYAAARLWVDGVINPADSRRVISMGIEAANHNPEIRPYQTGVLQT